MWSLNRNAKITLYSAFLGMEITRPYTVVVPSLCSSDEDRNKRYLFLMIKIYPNGTLTPSLLHLNVGKKT